MVWAWCGRRWASGGCGVGVEWLWGGRGVSVGWVLLCTQTASDSHRSIAVHVGFLHLVAYELVIALAVVWKDLVEQHAHLIRVEAAILVLIEAPKYRQGLCPVPFSHRRWKNIVHMVVVVDKLIDIDLAVIVGVGICEAFAEEHVRHVA